MTPEEIIKTFEMIWALSEGKAKLALFGLIMMQEGGGKTSSIKEILTQKKEQGGKDS